MPGLLRPECADATGDATPDGAVLLAAAGGSDALVPYPASATPLSGSAKSAAVGEGRERANMHRYHGSCLLTSAGAAPHE